MSRLILEGSVFTSTPEEIARFKEKHTHCTLEGKVPTQITGNVATLRCAYHSDLILVSIPYRTFCLDPLKCAGLSSCPRDYACSE